MNLYSSFSREKETFFSVQLSLEFASFLIDFDKAGKCSLVCSAIRPNFFCPLRCLSLFLALSFFLAAYFTSLPSFFLCFPFFLLIGSVEEGENTLTFPSWEVFPRSSTFIREVTYTSLCFPPFYF